MPRVVTALVRAGDALSRLGADVERTLYAAIRPRDAYLGGPCPKTLTLELSGWNKGEAEIPVGVDDDYLILCSSAEDCACWRREVDIQSSPAGSPLPPTVNVSAWAPVAGEMLTAGSANVGTAAAKRARLPHTAPRYDEENIKSLQNSGCARICPVLRQSKLWVCHNLSSASPSTEGTGR